MYIYIIYYVLYIQYVAAVLWAGEGGYGEGWVQIHRRIFNAMILVYAILHYTILTLRRCIFYIF
jgi:hypothetical protein